MYTLYKKGINACIFKQILLHVLYKKKVFFDKQCTIVFPLNLGIIIHPIKQRISVSPKQAGIIKHPIQTGCIVHPIQTGPYKCPIKADISIPTKPEYTIICPMQAGII